MTELPTDLKPLVLQGDTRAILRTLPEKSVDCVTTSPPFFGLRRYDMCPCSQGYVREEGTGNSPPKKADGAIRAHAPDPGCKWCGGTGKVPGKEVAWGGNPGCAHVWEATPPRRSRTADDSSNSPIQQNNRGSNYNAGGGKLCAECGCWFGSLGLEPTVGMYIDHLLEVMRELHRVLKDTGIAWIEMGDSYATSKSIPAKNLMLVPFRFALAVQDAGWIVRADIPWVRNNPMPESCKDRPTRSHSFIFMLTKKPRYFYDPDGYREPLSEATNMRISQKTFWSQTGGAKDYRLGINPNRSVRRTMENLAIRVGVTPKSTEPGSGIKTNSSFGSATAMPLPEGIGRNMRDSWIINTQALSEPHYASFPEEIPRRTILLSTSAKGNCAGCGAPWRRPTTPIYARVREPSAEGEGWRARNMEGSGANRNAAFTREGVAVRVAVPIGDTMGSPLQGGWAPTCSCLPNPCPKCGKPWENKSVGVVVSAMNVRVRDAKRGALAQKSGLGGEVADATDEEIGAYDDKEANKVVDKVVSWPACSCGAAPLPAVVLDPFAGSGTVLKVARELGRRSIGIELNPFYCDIARRRAGQFADLLAYTPALREGA